MCDNFIALKNLLISLRGSFGSIFPRNLRYSMIQRVVFLFVGLLLGVQREPFLWRPLGGPGGAFGCHFEGLWLILAAFRAQTASKTPSSLYFGVLGAKKRRRTASKI